MDFWASAEVWREADPALDRARRNVEPYLNSRFKNGSLADIACEIQYIPRVMKSHFETGVPEGFWKSEGVCCISPELSCDIFMSRDFEAELNEYVRGIVESMPVLSDIGLSTRQEEELLSILAEATRDIMANEPDTALFKSTLRGPVRIDENEV